jgi:hypothetical protein
MFQDRFDAAQKLLPLLEKYKSNPEVLVLAISKFFLSLDDKSSVPEKMLERAIGVVYAPHAERQSHYFYASLAEQFDAVIHYDTTTALEPLEKTSLWLEGEVPESYPSGL